MLPFCCQRGQPHGKNRLFMRFLTVWGLLPLDGGAGLGGEVEEDAVDALYLVGDAGGDVL